MPPGVDDARYSVRWEVTGPHYTRFTKMEFWRWRLTSVMHGIMRVEGHRLKSGREWDKVRAENVARDAASHLARRLNSKGGVVSRGVEPGA